MIDQALTLVIDVVFGLVVYSLIRSGFDRYIGRAG